MREIRTRDGTVWTCVEEGGGPTGARLSNESSLEYSDVRLACTSERGTVRFDIQLSWGDLPESVVADYIEAAWNEKVRPD